MSDQSKGSEESGLFDLPLHPLPRPGQGAAPGGSGEEALAAETAADDEPVRRSRPPRRAPRTAVDEPELPLFAPPPPERWAEPAEGADPDPAVRSPLAEFGRDSSPPTTRAASPASPAWPQPVPDAPAAAPRETEPRAHRRQAAGFRPRLIAAAVDAGIHLGVAGLGLAAAAFLGVSLGVASAPAFALFLAAFSFLYSVLTLAFWGQTPGMAAAGLVARSGGDQPLSFGQTGLRWLAGLLTVALCGLPLLVALTGRSFADRLSGSGTFGK